jgi:tripartite-type tricarboxylate transporter receptor subunit TctC
MHTRRSILAGAASTLLGVLPIDAAAQGPAYPSRMIRFLVPFPAGGATDVMTRNIAQELGTSWKQSVTVENRAGAGGMVGAEVVAKAPADGYMVLAATIAHSSGVSLYPKAPFQLEKDLQAVAIMGLIPLVPVVRADSAIRSLQDLLAASNSRPLNAGSSGNGTAAHLVLELFKSAAGAKIAHIPYKGGAPAMTDLLGGQIDVIFALLPECLPHVKSGKLRALAVTTDKRHPLLPDTPTTAEAGFPGLMVTSWNGLMVPMNTPREIVRKMNAEINAIAARPEVAAKLTELGYQTLALDVAQTEAFIQADIKLWAKVIRESGIKAE